MHHTFLVVTVEMVRPKIDVHLRKFRKINIVLSLFGPLCKKTNSLQALSAARLMVHIWAKSKTALLW